MLVDNAYVTEGDPCEFIVEVPHRSGIVSASVGRTRSHQSLPSFNHACSHSTLLIWDDQTAPLPSADLIMTSAVDLDTRPHYPDGVSMCDQTTPPATYPGINAQWTASSTPLAHMECKFDVTTGLMQVQIKSGDPAAVHLHATIPARSDDAYNANIANFWIRMGFTEDQWGLRPIGGSGPRIEDTGRWQLLVALLPVSMELTRNIFVVADIMGPSYVSTPDAVESRNILFATPCGPYDVEEDVSLYARRALSVVRESFDSISFVLLDDRMAKLTLDGSRIRFMFELRLYTD